ncbi:unnamed protein product [Coregonus sp. 'balchen']|nr:unnamed protein product [Coregonus sp. 'balchen']
MVSPGATSSPLSILVPKTKTKKKHFVQQKVEVFQASDPVLCPYINDLVQVPDPVMHLPDDFKANTKIKVSNHLFNKETLPGHFKFKEYCPQVFRNLREHFGIEDLDYQLPMRKDVNFRNNMQKVYVREEEKERIMDKLNRDVKASLLVRLRIMDYGLLLGIHNVGRTEEEEMEEESYDDCDEVDKENGLTPAPAVGFYGTSPEGIAGYMNSFKPLGPGEFDPYIYAKRFHEFIAEIFA